jgi:predicted GIY-YIG superfamily endonuclease
MAFWTYMLRCSDGRFYTGHTEDLDVRLAQHRQGYFRSCWTFRRRPVELVWSEAFPTRDEALEAERMVGGWSQAKKRALVAGEWNLVSFLARPPRERGQCFSTSLETNGGAGEPSPTSPSSPAPFASSEVEKRGESHRRGHGK